MRKILKNIIKLAKDIESKEITVYSAQASFYVIISALPFIMLLISLTGFLIPYYKNNLISLIESFVPKTIAPSVYSVISELFKKSLPAVSLTSFAVLWSASRGVLAIERGIQKIYDTKPYKNFFVSSLFSLIYTILFIIALILTLIVQVFSDIIISEFLKNVIFSNVEIIIIKGIFYTLLLTVIFDFLYYFLGKRKYAIKNHIIGALFSALGWAVFSNIYSLYIENFSNYSYIYGSLTAIVLMMLWLYACILIFLLGAELNSIMIKIKKKEW